MRSRMASPLCFSNSAVHLSIPAGLSQPTTPTRLPLLRYPVMRCPTLREPSSATVSCASAGVPAAWMRSPCCSVQKRGNGVYGLADA